MKVELNNIEISQFLQETTTQDISFLEEGKEKSDLIESAKKRGILVENSKDLGVIKTIFAFTDKVNANGCVLPKEKFLKVLPQLVGKPQNINHLRTYAVGYYIDYAFVQPNKAIAYSIFFKSYYPDEWEEAQKKQKEGKLSSSFEIWSPQNKRKYNENGSYSLDEMELGGGALIFEDKNNKPAFKDAKVLEIAREVIAQEYLETASKYRCKDIIIDGEISSCGSCQNCDMKKAEEVKTPEAPKPVEQPKITCENCKEQINFSNIPKITETTCKCPKCSAVIDNTGKMIYPPQIKDFNCSCPSCKSSNWLTLSRNEDTMDLKCQSCQGEFVAEFAKKQENDFRTFIYTGYARCPQCGNGVEVITTSKINKKEIECPRCTLSFNYEINNEYFKKLKKISPKVVLAKSKDEGGKTEMEIPKEVEQKVAAMEAAKVQEEAPTVAPSVPEPPKVEGTVTEAPKQEEPKVEEAKVEEVKAEESQKEEAKVEEPKKEEPIAEAKVEESVKEEAKKTVEVHCDEEEESEKKKKKLERWQKSMVKTAKKCRKITKEKATLTKANVELETKLKAAEDKVAELQKDNEKVISESNAKIEFHKANAQKVYDRKKELEKYLSTRQLSDEEILDEGKYNQAKLEQENELLKAYVENKNVSDRVGDVHIDTGYIAKVQKEVKELAKC